MPRNELIEQPIELRRRQSLDWLPRRQHFQHVSWAVYERPFAQWLTTPPGWIGAGRALPSPGRKSQLVVVLLLNLLVAELFGLGDRAVELGNQALSPLRTKSFDGLLGGNNPLRLTERIVHNFIA